MNEGMDGWMDGGVDECRWILSIIIQFLKPPALTGLRRAPCSKILMQHQHHIPPESSVTSRFVGITHQLYIATLQVSNMHVHAADISKLKEGGHSPMSYTWLGEQ